MKINYFKLFFYISFIFLIIALIRGDFLNVPFIYNSLELTISFGLLFIAFIFNALSWTKTIVYGGFSVKNRVGIASLGLSIFGKYIPGKLWIILGRAEYIVKKYNYPRKSISLFSLNAQLLSLWIGLLIGAFGVIVQDMLHAFGILILILFVLLSLVLFTNFFHDLIIRLYKIILKKEIILPRLSIKSTIKVVPWYFINWLLWSISFYFLASSISADIISVHLGWGFSLAGSLGILAVIAPGGLGVREGVLTGYLTLAGINIQDATTIAIASRLWFLIGEIFIFLLGLFLDHSNKLETNKLNKFISMLNL